MSKIIWCMEDLFNLAPAYGFSKVNYNENIGYAIFRKGSDLVCVEPDLSVKLRDREGYESDSEYEAHLEMQSLLGEWTVIGQLQ